MGKAIVISLILVSMIAPGVAARDRNGGRGLRRMLATLLVFTVVYALYLFYVHAPSHVPVMP